MGTSEIALAALLPHSDLKRVCDSFDRLSKAFRQSGALVLDTAAKKVYKSELDQLKERQEDDLRWAIKVIEGRWRLDDIRLQEIRLRAQRARAAAEQELNNAPLRDVFRDRELYRNRGSRGLGLRIGGVGRGLHEIRLSQLQWEEYIRNILPARQPQEDNNEMLARVVPVDGRHPGYLEAQRRQSQADTAREERIRLWRLAIDQSIRQA